MTALVYTLGVVLFALGVIASIALHEVGHMYPAKKFGVKVTQYFVGFGNTVWSKKVGETEYGIKSIPLGGYVKIVGMLPPDKDGHLRESNTGMFTQLIADARAAEAEHVEEGDEDRLFYKMAWWKKVIVMAGGPTVNLLIAFFLFWGIQVFIILKGVEGIKHLETWSAPLLLGGGLVLLIWAAWRAGGLGRVLTESAALQKQHGEFWHIFPGALTASVGYWATLSLNIPDFTRYARSQRSQMMGQALGLPLTMTAFAFIGVAVTSATLLIYGVAIPNPVDLMSRFDNVLIILFATAVIFAAQLTTNMAANVVSPSNDFSNLNPRLISYVTGGLITAVIGILMMPWKLMASMGAYIFTWLIGYSGLMGAIAGILICDYWVIRKQRLDLAGLFEANGPYRYGNGFNWRAIVALVVAIIPVVPGFLRAATTPGGQVTDPNFFDSLYTYAWFVTFALGFGIYYVLTKIAKGESA